jgi:hypothetical protein
MAGTQPRTSSRSLFTQLEILPVPCQHILSLMHPIINNHENLKQIHLCTISTQEIKKKSLQTKCQPVLFSKKYILFWYQNFQQFTRQCDNRQE